MQINFWILLLCSSSALFFELPTKFNFCKIEKEKCHGRPHIGCSGHAPGVSVHSQDCTDKKLVPMTAKMKQMIVDEHNSKRNLIATGKLAGFPPACRMKVMKWSDELAAAAESHVTRCVFAHDRCRATSKWEYSGQNIAIMWHSHEQKDMESMIRRKIQLWWDEYKLVPGLDCVSIVRNLGSRSVSETGHFLLMIREINSEIGCAALSYRNDSRLPYNYLFTCNYPETNMNEEPIYGTAAPCSECKTYGSTSKCSKKYNALCE